MNGERVYEILQQLDDDLIAAADPAVQKLQKPVRWKRLLPLAAAVVLVAAVWRLGGLPPFGEREAEQESAMQAQTETASAQTEAVPEVMIGDAAEDSQTAADSETGEFAGGSLLAEELPKLAAAPIVQDGGGEFYMGYRSAEDIPVFDFRLALIHTETLPVYRYPGGMLEDYHLIADEAAMRQKAEEMARVFGLDPDTMDHNPTKIQNGDKETGVTEEAQHLLDYTLMNDEVIVAVDPSLNASVLYRDFEAPAPEEEVWRLSEAGQKEQGEKLAALLKSRFGWKNPVVVVRQSDVNFLGKTHYSMFVYESDPDPLQNLLNQQLKTARGGYTWEGSLDALHLNTWDAFDYAGDYPVRTEAEARAALAAGEHLSAGPEFPGEAFIAQTELVYLDNHTDILMPYYVFYTEMPDERFPDIRSEGTENWQDDVKVYRSYVVPAVQAEFLEELPAREIRGQ